MSSSNVITSFLSASTKYSMVRSTVVRALSTHHTFPMTPYSTSTTRLVSPSWRSSVARHQPKPFPECLLHATSQRRVLSKVSSVEEELDAALEDILSGTYRDVERGTAPLMTGTRESSTRGNSNIRRSSSIAGDAFHVDATSEYDNAVFHDGAATVTPMQGSHPVPNKLVDQEILLDVNEPAFLSTSNPRWVQAGLDPAVIDILSSKGITTFTPVQGTAFDPIMARRDVIGRSRTGTGKTLAFALPCLTRLVKWTEQTGKRDPTTGQMQRGRKVSMLVICPTRELARQVKEEMAEVATPLGFFTEVFHGGVSYDPQARALRQGLDVAVGTPGRIMDHMDRGNLDLSECDIVVLDEADEMLNMGFADDVEVILKNVGAANKQKTQCLLFSATTPSWVKEIGRQYQTNVLAIDSTAEEGGARVATTVRHLAVQLPPGVDSKKACLEDIIAVEISKDAKLDTAERATDNANLLASNPLAAAAAAKKRSSKNAMQQAIFGKTIVFTETKAMADELVSGRVFNSLTAQALHGDIGQRQRDATLLAFREGAFNVLVATDVAARGIDIKDVDLVIQFDPPRDADTYVHRSGRTGRAGKKGVSVLLFEPSQARDIVRIERDLAHNFKFDLVGPPSVEASLKAAAKSSAIASQRIPEDTAKYFRESALALLAADGEDAVQVIARCLAAISRRSTEAQSRSLITGEVGLATVQMKNPQGYQLTANDVMITVSKLSRLSRLQENGDLAFDGDIGKIESSMATPGVAIFDMSVDEANKLVAFTQASDVTAGTTFEILHALEIERSHDFGHSRQRQATRRPGGRLGGNDRFDRNSYGSFSSRDGGRGDNNNNSRGNYRGGYSSGRGGTSNFRDYGGSGSGSGKSYQGNRDGHGLFNGNSTPRPYNDKSYSNNYSNNNNSNHDGYRGRYDTRRSSTSGESEEW